MQNSILIQQNINTNIFQDFIKNMKILLANYRYFVSGGPERYMFNVKNELEKRDHHIIPFSVKYPENKPCAYSKYFVAPLGTKDEVYFDQQKMTPTTLYRTLSRLFYSKEVERSVSQLISDTQPQIALVLHYLRKISPSLLVALKNKKVPIIVRLSDYAMVCPQTHCLRNQTPCDLCAEGDIHHSIKFNCVKNSKITSITNALAAWFHSYMRYFDLVDCFITTNMFMYKMMVRAGWSEEKLICIPTFTDTEIFRPKNNFSKSNYICYVGRLENLKGIHVLVNAFIAMQKTSSSNVSLKIAGTGSDFYFKQLKSTISNAGMENCIQFTGQLDASQLSQFLGNALLTVVPSLWFENLPNTILESYACGTPVIASDIGSLPDCVKKGKTGDLFKAGDTQDLTETLKFYLNHPEILKKMAKNSRDEASRQYSPKAHINSLEHLFNQYI